MMHQKWGRNLYVGKLRNNIYGFAITIYLFMVLFNPYLLPVSMNRVTLGIALLIILINCRLLKDSSITSNLWKLTIGFFPFTVYIIILTLIHIVTEPTQSELYLDSLRTNLGAILRAIVYLTAFALSFKRHGVSLRQFQKIVIAVGLIQLLFVLLCYILPSFRFSILELTATRGNQMLQSFIETLGVAGYHRGYGLSWNLYDPFGYIIALIISTTLVYGLNDRKFIYVAVLMLIMPLLNTRSGFVLAIIAMAVIALSTINMRNIFRYIVGSVLLVAVVAYFLNNGSSVYTRWVRQGFGEVVNLLQGSRSGIFEYLLTNNIILPKNVLFGDGAFPHYLINYNVDNGYINSIWTFGIVGTTLLFLGYMSLFRIGFSCSYRYSKALVRAFAIVFFIYLIKLYSIQQDAPNILMITMIYLMLNCDEIYSSVKNQKRLHIDSVNGPCFYSTQETAKKDLQ